MTKQAKHPLVAHLLQESIQGFLAHFIQRAYEQFPDHSFNPHAEAALTAFHASLAKTPPSNPGPTYCAYNADLMLVAIILGSSLRTMSDELIARGHTLPIPPHAEPPDYEA